MDHVGRAERDARRLPEREVEFVGGLDPGAGGGIAILDAPPPLMAGDADLQRVAGAGAGDGALDQEAARDEDGEADDDQRGPGDQPAGEAAVGRVDAGLARLAPVAARAQQADAEPGQHQQVHEAAHRHHQPEQRMDACRLLARGGERRLEAALARRERQHRRQQREPAQAHGSTGPVQLSPCASPTWSTSWRRRFSGFSWGSVRT